MTRTSTVTGSVIDREIIPIGPLQIVRTVIAQYDVMSDVGTSIELDYNNTMEHTTVPEPPGFRELPKDQQVLYIQALWDSIQDGDDSVPVLESQLRVAEERLRALRQNPGSAVCARQMLKDVASASS